MKDEISWLKLPMIRCAMTITPSLVWVVSSVFATMYIYPGCSSNLATWMDDRRPTPSILLFKGHAALSNTARPRMKSNARNMTTKEDIHLHGVQNFFFFELTPPPEGMSNTVMPLLGGRRKVPPSPRCLLRRRRSPCSNFGGRLACNELIIDEYCSGQYLASMLSCMAISE